LILKEQFQCTGRDKKEWLMREIRHGSLVTFKKFNVIDSVLQMLFEHDP
jgi:hypothetical protein